MLVDLAAILAVHLLPGQIAGLRDIGDVLGRALRIGQVLGADGEVLGIVVAPVEAGSVAEPFVLRAAPQPGMVGAKLVHGDLIVLV